MSKQNSFDITFFSVLIFVIFTIVSQDALSETLDLDQFLMQVSEKNESIEASKSKSQGSELRSLEGDHLTATSFFTEAQITTDERQTANPSFQGSKTTLQNYKLGFSQPTRWGSQLKLYYGLTSTEIAGASPLFIKTPTFHDAYPTLELSQSLWSNAFGISTRAQQKMLESSAKATAFAESYRVKQELYSAEIVYWRLAVAREIVKVQTGAIERAEKIKEWNNKRVKLNLADRSDLLQSEAALKLRKLEFKAAQDEERAASQSFNLARNLNSSKVEELLSLPDPKKVITVSLPDRVEMREDVRAAEQSMEVAAASSDVNRHKTLPNLELFGSYARYWRDADRKEAMSNVWRPDHPLWVAGLRFNAPLDFFDSADIREGAIKEKYGAEKAYHRKLLEQEVEWTDLKTKLEELKSRLELSVILEDAQLEKITHEKKRLEKGKTTTYQALLFEQDYSQSQLTRLQYQLQVLQAAAQLKLFGGKRESR
ncbi:MAG: TolC family protein [Bacteriovoracia bacterium]